MLRFDDPGQVPADFGPSVVTIGTFDGVHGGHQAVLSAVVHTAQAAGQQSIAVTFEPHPLAVLAPERAPAMITDLAGRLSHMQAMGLDAVLVMRFTRELAAQTPREFVEQIFVDTLHASAVVVGQDTKFGVKNSGDVHTLRELGAEFGFTVRTLEDVGNDHRWSSTEVRSLVGAGDVAGAAAVLGRPHAVSGQVVKGLQRGRELGYPTANLARDSAGLIPADGVYAGWLVRDTLPVEHPDHRMPAAISVGTNPTFDDVRRRTVEAYVLDRTDLDLYDEVVRVEFVQRLRGNTKFESVESLVTQIAADVDQARGILAAP